MNKNTQTTTETRQEKLSAALETIAEVLVRRDLESVRDQVGKMETGTAERIRSVQGEMTEAIDRVMKDLSTRIEELTQQLDKAEESRTAALAKVKKDVKGDLDQRAESLGKSLETLTAGLSAVQLELQQQMMATERVSGVLNNMATVFSGPAATAAPPLAVGEENLDNALDQMFESAGTEVDLEADPKPPTEG